MLAEGRLNDCIHSCRFRGWQVRLPTDESRRVVIRLRNGGVQDVADLTQEPRHCNFMGTIYPNVRYSKRARLIEKQEVRPITWQRKLQPALLEARDFI